MLERRSNPPVRRSTKFMSKISRNTFSFGGFRAAQLSGFTTPSPFGSGEM
jgi:hypothetical protein